MPSYIMALDMSAGVPGAGVSTVTCSRLSRPSFKFSQVVVK